MGEPRSSPCLQSSCRPAPALCPSRRARAGCSLGQRVAALPGVFCPSSEGPGTAQRVTGLRHKGSAGGVDPTASSQCGAGWGEPPRTPKAAGARQRGASTDADRDPSDSLDPARLLPTDQGSANRQSGRQGRGRGAGRQGGHGVGRLGCGPALGGTSRAVASAHPWGSMLEAREPEGGGERAQASGSADTRDLGAGRPVPPPGDTGRTDMGSRGSWFPTPTLQEALAQDPHRRTAGVHDGVRPPHPEPGGAL